MSPSEFRNASCGWTLHGSMAGAFLCRLSVVTTALFLVVCCNLPSIVTDTQITEGWVTLGRICKFSAPRSRCTNAKCQRRAQKMHFEYKNVTSFRGLRPLDQGLFSWTQLGLRLQTPVIGSRSTLATILSTLNSLLCSTKFFLKYALLPRLSSWCVHQAQGFNRELWWVQRGNRFQWAIYY